MRRNEPPAPDPVRQYLDEIGQVPLLTADEEVALARRIEAGVQATESLGALADGASPDGCAARRAELIATIADADAARSHLARANLRLVVSIAKRFAGRGVPLLDLVQEGNLGLLRAVEKFDHHRGFRFSTYASWWIRQAVSSSLAEQSRTIRLPAHVAEESNRVARAQRQLTAELEREPSAAEIAERVGVGVGRVDELRRIALDTLSLDSPVGDDDDSSLGDFVTDASTDAPVDAAARQSLADILAEVLGELSGREQELMRLRFGLGDTTPRTLDEVGREFRVTRERVRQIEAKTLAKLRHPQHRARLVDFLEG